MRIWLNRQEREVAPGTTIATLMADLGIDLRRNSVALNGKILRIADYPTTTLAEGDKVLTIRMIAGGTH